MGGWARAATAARAQALAWPGVVPLPSAIDVPGAIIDNKATLDWMIRSKTTGGLGYTVTRAKQTHAYAGLLKLGGVWP